MKYEDIKVNRRVQFHRSFNNWEPRLCPSDGMCGVVVEVKPPDECFRPKDHAAKVIWDDTVSDPDYGKGPWWYVAADLYPASTGEF